MRIELRPEPREGERAAIDAALKRQLGGRSRTHPAYASRWRRAALQLDGAPYATARPRRSRGATRA